VTFARTVILQAVELSTRCTYWTPRHAGSSHQNWARPTEFSSCCTDRLELSSGTPALVADSL